MHRVVRILLLLLLVAIRRWGYRVSLVICDCIISLTLSRLRLTFLHELVTFVNLKYFTQNVELLPKQVTVGDGVSPVAIVLVKRAHSLSSLIRYLDINFVDAQLHCFDISLGDCIFADIRVVVQNEFELVSDQLLSLPTNKAASLDEQTQTSILEWNDNV